MDLFLPRTRMRYTSYYACCPQMTKKYQPWIHDDQIAGFYQQFGNLTFLTVKVRTIVSLSVIAQELSCFYFHHVVALL